MEKRTKKTVCLRRSIKLRREKKRRKRMRSRSLSRKNTMVRIWDTKKGKISMMIMEMGGLALIEIFNYLKY